MSQPKEKRFTLMNLKQSLGMIASIVMIFMGMLTLAVMKLANSTDGYMNLIVLTSGGLMVVVGIYHVAMIICGISDPFLFVFFGRIRSKFKSMDPDEMSVYVLLGSVVAVTVSFVAFMFATNIHEAITYAFIFCILVPVLGFSVRVYMRLLRYRSIYMAHGSNEEEESSPEDDFYNRNVR